MYTGLTTAWIAELILIAYRGGKQTGAVRPIAHLAMPAEYASTFVIYGALSLVPEGPWSRTAGLVGWGIGLATLLNLWSPPSSSGASKVKQIPAAKSPANTGVTTA